MRFTSQNRSCFLAQIICLLVLSFHSISAQQKVPYSAIDLRSKGYFEIPMNSPTDRIVLGDVNGQVAFLGPDRVAVSFLVANKNIGLTDHEHLSGGKWLFHTLAVNANSGQSEAEWTWRSASQDDRVVPLQTGQFLVAGQELITLQQLDGKTMWRLDLPKTDIYGAQPYGFAVVSDTGNTIFVVSDKDKETESVEVYRTSDLHTVSTFTIPYQGLTDRMTASDKGLFFTYPGQNQNALAYIDRFGTFSQRVWVCQDSGACSHVQFVGNDGLVLNNTPHSIVLLDNQGRVIQRHELGKELINHVSVCSNGTRLMVELDKWGGGSAFFDTYGKVKAARIAILDTDTLKEIASLPLDPKQPVRAGINPTGDLVAYIDKGMLKFWSVPTPAKTK